MAEIDNFRLPEKAPEPPPSGRRRTILNRTFEAGLPSAVDAEKTILGAVLLDNEAFLEAKEFLFANDFSLDSHRRIFLRMGDLMDVNRTIDIVTLSNELSKNKEIEAIGGVAYLASLTEGLPRRPVIAEYMRIVKDKSTSRQLMGLASATIEKCADQSEDALGIATWHAAELETIVAGGVHQGLEHVADITIEVLDRYLTQFSLTESPGFSYGIEDIDKATGGIQAGEQLAIGCYSGVGKTTMLAQIVAANCWKDHPMAMFLIEPTRHDFLRRLWSIVGGVRYGAATKPWTASKDERDRLTWAAQQVTEWPLHLIDRSSLTLEEELAHARLAMHRHGVELICVDYLQRLKVKAMDKSEDTRLKMGRASTSNADLVKNTRCRSVILSQLSRSGGMTALPTMDKLRESGQIENDASTIVLLHLKYDEEQGHFTDEGAAIIPKQRFGVPCNVKLYKDPRTALWCCGEKPPPDHQQSLYNAA